MGLGERASALAPAGTGLIDPRTGRPVGADDGFFVGLNDELSDKERCAAAGAAAYLLKPIQKKKLIATIKAATKSTM